VLVDPVSFTTPQPRRTNIVTRYSVPTHRVLPLSAVSDGLSTILE
jgi:hypothetical protein